MASRSNILLVGDTITTENLGTGACIFYCKNTSSNLQFKTISVSGSLSMITGGTTLIISGTGGGGIGWSNLANGSTVAGCGTVASGSTICNNTFYGVNAGKKITTGCSNVAE